ncbi:MAG: hypothetical protein ACYDA0_13945 [Candidatus Dormibacteraceae bacterium]
MVTLLVDDLEKTVAELAQRGIATEATDDSIEGCAKVTITDPVGSRITLGQNLSAGELPR